MSSTSFTVGIHLCKGSVESISMFSKPEVCEMEKKLPPCHRTNPNPCCEDDSIVHESEDIKANPSHELAGPHLVLFAQDLIVIAEVIPEAPISKIDFRQYDPPLRSTDLIVEHRVLLI
jgi:hypothetical protein